MGHKERFDYLSCKQTHWVDIRLNEFIVLHSVLFSSSPETEATSPLQQNPVVNSFCVDWQLNPFGQVMKAPTVQDLGIWLLSSMWNSALFGQRKDDEQQ